MTRSTMLILGAAIVGQPFIWVEHPLTALGALLFNSLLAVMCLLFLSGIAYLVIDREE